MNTTITGTTRRVLVVTDHTNPSPELMHAIVERCRQGDVRLRLVVLNPAGAELHLLHPQRHDKAAEAERALVRVLPQIEAATCAPVIGSVSVRHDPMDAIEATLADEPVDEIVLAVPQHRTATRLHQDLAHRLAHRSIPVTVVNQPSAHAAR